MEVRESGLDEVSGLKKANKNDSEASSVKSVNMFSL